MYTGKAAALLAGFGAGSGDLVEVVLSTEGLSWRPDGRPLVLKGTVMGPFGPGTDRDLVLKLSSGYNYCFSVERAISLKVVGRSVTTPAARAAGPGDAELPLVALIGTGGTIASYVDHRTGAVCPVSSADDLVYLLPELGSLCRTRVSVPISKLSEDMGPDDWMVIAREIVEAFGAGVRGVVVAHGTDTLAHTAAALSFVLRDLPGPVVLTGSQRSSDRPSSDSFSNLLHSITLAARSDIGEVCVLMHASMSDGVSAVHRGSRVRKMHTSRRDAFRSMNSEPIGTVTDDGFRLSGPYRRADPSSGPSLEGSFSNEVLLLSAQMTLDERTLRELGKARRALVIAGTGLGHVSSSLVPAVSDLVREGRPIVIASSCLNGRVDLRVYSTGRELLAAGALEAGDLTPETALVKTMWCMGKLGREGWTMEQFRELFSSDLSGELNPRSPHTAFPWPAGTEGKEEGGN